MRIRSLIDGGTARTQWESAKGFPYASFQTFLGVELVLGENGTESMTAGVFFGNTAQRFLGSGVFSVIRSEQIGGIGVLMVAVFVRVFRSLVANAAGLSPG